MSMVGHVLGLGDRHLSNLMLHRRTGKLVHIDFGDCFEVAQQREKYPEKIPSGSPAGPRYVSGIEGNFRSTCESVMRVLREHRDSVMALLEAFVHDPLINWRLLTPHDAVAEASPSDEDAEESAIARPAARHRPQSETTRQRSAQTRKTLPLSRSLARRWPGRTLGKSRRPRRRLTRAGRRGSRRRRRRPDPD